VCDVNPESSDNEIAFSSKLLLLIKGITPVEDKLKFDSFCSIPFEMNFSDFQPFPRLSSPYKHRSMLYVLTKEINR